MSSQIASHQQWPSESSHEASPPGSVSSESRLGKREKAKQVIGNLLNKFQRSRRDSSASRTSVDRRVSKSRPQSLVAISSERPAPIPITVSPNMDTLNSSPSKRGKLFRRFSISSSSDSVRSHESEHSNSGSLMQRVQDAVRPESTTTSDQVESTVAQLPPAMESGEPAAESVGQTAPAGLGESMVIIPSPIQEEPTNALTAEEESVASLSPGLPPVLAPDEDVDRLSLEGASDVPVTPPSVTPEPRFVVPELDECEGVAARDEPVISAAAVETPSKKVAPVYTIEVKASLPTLSRAPEVQDNAGSPTLSQYLINLVAPENLEQFRRPIGYSLTALCYGLTWYLVTQVPGQALI
ncbi:hypothetical protein BDY19DRAFT_971129 [Irpex rosettiformis]|uniref:Uncharacterized protein n=1 Tax=Irpex rosettiformis TaxID=378272 RepID=A0ACB8TQX2_9APHY|nr:hypothetical protein BDY19DRAFT_971129 [Irpex rosettiformis]